MFTRGTVYDWSPAEENHELGSPRISFDVFRKLDLFEDTRNASKNVKKVYLHIDRIIEKFLERSPLICPFFAKGVCRFRKNCRYEHNIGMHCPLCNEDMAEKWTDQSKHLKKCFQEHLEAEQLEKSRYVRCSMCYVQVVKEHKDFGILENCFHHYCYDCAATLSGNCLICGAETRCVVRRDRLIFDPERKMKHFGMHLKKLSKHADKISGEEDDESN